MNPSASRDTLPMARCTSSRRGLAGGIFTAGGTDTLSHYVKWRPSLGHRSGFSGGQAMDLASVGKQLTLAQLEHMHNLKTGALIRASVKTAAITGAATPAQLATLDKFAQNIGLAFQVQDDILDADEIKDNKSTYVALLGIEPAKAKLQQLQQQALQELQSLDMDTRLLCELTNVIINL